MTTASMAIARRPSMSGRYDELPSVKVLPGNAAEEEAGFPASAPAVISFFTAGWISSERVGNDSVIREMIDRGSYVVSY